MTIDLLCVRWVVIMWLLCVTCKREKAVSTEGDYCKSDGRESEEMSDRAKR